MMSGQMTVERHKKSKAAVEHIPVLLEAMLKGLNLRDGANVIDGTFGGGGYARAILEYAQTRVIGLDRDPLAVIGGRSLQTRFGRRLCLIQAPFSQMNFLAHAEKLDGVDAVVLDIGVSSMQLDTPERGFSFQHSGPLDMRMSQSGLSAFEVVNTFDEADLADIIYHYGEERHAKKIARAIVRQRQKSEIATTKALADLVAGVPGMKRDGGKNPATRTFQALRIFVNQELEELASGLQAAESVLKPGGRLAVVTFHSLEDRLVKHYFAERIARPGANVSRHMPEMPSTARRHLPSFKVITKRPIVATEEEMAINPRARSAKLRIYERTDAPRMALKGDITGLPDIAARVHH